MTKQQIKRAVTPHVGHLRRAQRRLERAIHGRSESDVAIQAGLGALCAAVGLRLVRSPGIGTVLARWMPVIAFAAIYRVLSRR